jgi:ABC-type sulfate/molybdate transport systems ATPase subunit
VSAAAIVLRGVEKAYGPVRAVRPATLAVARGELFAVLGPSGCGKTTLLRLIAGFERPDAGSIEVGGEPQAGEGRWVPPERRRIGMVFQDYALFPHLTVAENICFGIDGATRALRRRQGLDPRAKGALELVGLQHKAERYPHELSGGERQRVALARALAPEPAVVLLDEPFSSLDASLRAGLRREVELILREAGASAVLVTHDQEEALSLADRIAVMRDGAVVQTGTPEDVYHRPAGPLDRPVRGGGQRRARRRGPARRQHRARLLRPRAPADPASSASRCAPSSSSCATTATATRRSPTASSAATTCSTACATRRAARSSCSCRPWSSTTSASACGSARAAARWRRCATDRAAMR